MKTQIVSKSEKYRSFLRLFSGTLLIAGTAIGAGMLGIPLLTAKAGFIPALVITVAVWFFMLLTGLLFLEVALWMPEGANLLSMTCHFLGLKGKWAVGAMFVFLYYCLLVAYFAAGAPLLSHGIGGLLGVELGGNWGFLVFGLLFGSVVAAGAKSIDRTNMILTLAMVFSYAMMLGIGSSKVEIKHLLFTDWSVFFLAVPVLFSAFGYHNVIPSLCTYLKREKRSLRLSIIAGTTLSLVIYLLWQWLIIGAVPREAIAQALEDGMPATKALEAVSSNSSIYLVGQYFAFFAIVTSLLGVAFSMVDFLGDGLKMVRQGLNRVVLTVLVFLPPFICVMLDPAIFDQALGVAGGFGEAFLNGLLPVSLVWVGRYVKNLSSPFKVGGGRLLLGILFFLSLLVIGLEAFYLIKGP
jgi:tyrosine-specific transport protein